jgi:predicted metalloprotease with PDZ domain
MTLAQLQQCIQQLGGQPLDAVVISTLRVVELRVPVAGTSYGFQLVGERPVRLAAVDVQSPAARVGLLKGMPVWSVNGVSTMTVGHSQVIELMKQKSEYMRLLVPL